MTISKFRKFKSADGRHVVNRNVAISQRKLSDLNEIWYTTASLELHDSHVTKCNFFNVADGRYIENRFWP